ncbi:MAG TPA: hypothetical protein VKH81_06470 [Candidatus Angelobacter sp.]|nr:hypothetical protein [Candidatus Angelobacter sp.]
MRRVILVSFSGLLIFLAGCGSVSSNTPGPTPTPTPVPSPTPNPSPSPTPNPSPTPSSTADSFLSTMFLIEGRSPSPIGPITVDTTANNGAGNLQLKSPGVNNTTLILQFCPYPQAFNGCSNVTSFTTDATGNANVNFTFPEKGTFSGLFQLLQTNTAEIGQTETGTSGKSFQSALLPAGTVTGGIQQTTGHAPGSGTAVVNGTTAHITLTATTPNHTFNTAVCDLFPQAPCTVFANITTDAQGNASTDVGTVQQPVGATIFRISDADGVEFVTAFRVQ